MERENLTDLTKKYIQDEIRPLDIKLYSVNSLSTDNEQGFILRLTMFDYNYGTIIPEVYQKVTTPSKREEQIFYLLLEKANLISSTCSDYDKQTPLLMLPCPHTLFTSLEGIQKFNKQASILQKGLMGKLCLIFDSLIIDDSELFAKISQTLQDNHIMLAIKGFGGKDSTPLKLKGKQLDYIFFTSDFTLNAIKNDKEEQFLLEYVSRLGFKCVVENRYNEKFNDIPKGAFSDDIFYIKGEGERIEDYINNKVIGRILQNIPYSIIEKYDLEDKSEPELEKILENISPSPQNQKVTYLDKSFLARLILSKSQTQEYYNSLRGELLSYKGIKVHHAWRYETFYLHSKRKAKLEVKGKTLYLYLDLNPSGLESYGLKLSTSKINSSTPVFYKITSQRKLKLSKNLISIMLKGLPKTNNTQDFSVEFEHFDENALIAKGLIKQKQGIFNVFFKKDSK